MTAMRSALAGRVVAALLRAGWTVGVTAQSHKVIGNLLHAIDRALGDARAEVHGVQRAPEGEGVALPWLAQAADYEGVQAALAAGARLVAGTAWLFARPEITAGWTSSWWTRRGSTPWPTPSPRARRRGTCPQQLRQVVQRGHPPGLLHVLEGRPTASPDRSLFLPVAWQLHPVITAFARGGSRSTAGPRGSGASVGGAPRLRIRGAPREPGGGRPGGRAVQRDRAAGRYPRRHRGPVPRLGRDGGGLDHGGL